MTDQNEPTSTVPELRASAHQLLLDPGLFCVYQAPIARPAARPAESWLPAVRLAASPSRVAGQITMTGLSDGGWLGAQDDAALVRVTGGRASLLVTIYQAADSAAEGPSLKVLRLSESAPAPATAPSAARGQSPPVPAELLAHIYARGDVPGRIGDWIGERGSRRWIEGFALTLPAPLAGSDVEYQAVLGRDWLSPWAEAGQFCGSRGMSLPIVGLAVRLRGPAAESHDIALSATFIDGSAAGPVGGGEPCRSEPLAPLESFQIVLSPKPARRPTRRRA